MSTDPLRTTLEDGVLTATIDRPERRNALNGAVIDALMEVVTQESARDEVRCIVLRGAGEKAFCSGADLQGGPMGGGPVAMHDQRSAFADLIRAMRACPVPIVAGLNGHVAAGGVGLMLGADLIVAVDDVHLSTPEIRVGLFPMMIMALISRVVGEKRALQLLLTGERIPAARALDWGLINETVPRADFEERLRALATQVASFSPIVLRLGRQAFYRQRDMELDAALDYLALQLSLNTLTEDAVEGMMAFMQKRDPVWKGC